MSAPPRVVIVLDPRPGSVPADRISSPGGQTLLTLVTGRATAEAGRADRPYAGGADLAGLLAGLATEGAGPLCLIDGSALALATTYGDLVADPRPEPALLQEPDGTVVGVRLDGPVGRDGDLTGPVTQTLVAAVAEAAPGQALGALGHVVLVTLTAAGVPVRAVRPDRFPLARVDGDDALAAALAAEAGVDEAALRLRRASRADDGFLSTFLIRPLSRRLTRRAVARGLRPNLITMASLALGLLAAAAYACARTGTALPWLIVGSLLLLGSLVVDCVDGEVARYTRTFSPLGGWLDVGSDRLKEYAVYAGLAIGARPTAWVLATAAFAILVVRHFVDFGYAATVSGGSFTTAPADPVASISARTSARPALLWAKRAVILPVGERTIALAVLAPIVGAPWTLGLLAAAGCVSAAYTLAGRLGRTLLAAHPVPASARPSAGVRERLRAQVDAGWVGTLLPAPTGRLGWLWPAAARVVEPVGVALLIWWLRPGALGAAYLVFAAVALHQYDVVYRQRLAGVVADGGVLGRIGWPARVVGLVVLTLALPTAGLRPVLLVSGAALGLAALLSSATWWRSFVRSGP